MKCQNCDNIANHHYTSNIDGAITEKHLCAECAQKLNVENNVELHRENTIEDIMNGFFGNARFLSSREGNRPVAPTFFIPLMFVKVDDGSMNEVKSPAATVETDPVMTKRRKINVMREQMKSAVEAEDFEKAAQLRDRIREMENSGSETEV